MRTIAPIDSGFLLSSALLILCLACGHANGEVNSKELLDDAGFDLETNDVESTSAIATQTTHGGPCRPSCAKKKKGWTTKCKWKKCTGCSACSTGGTPLSTPSTPSASPPASAGGQQADNQAGGCFFCGTPCPADCWNAMKDKVDKAVSKNTIKRAISSNAMQGWPGTIQACRDIMKKIPKNEGDPRHIYYAALVKNAKKYASDQGFKPDGGWLKYGMSGSGYCGNWKCGPMEYAKAGSSSDRCPNKSCKSFGHPGPCKLAGPNCKWMRWGKNKECRSVNVDQAELLQTTDNTTDKTETGLTNVQQSELDRLLDDVQTEANYYSVGGFSDCW